MKLIFWFAEKGYEKRLGPALISGAAAHGDEVVMRPLGEYREPEADGGIICGVVKREVLWDHQAKGRPLLYMDKGYQRDRKGWGGGSMPAWWRLCWNAVHPTDYLGSHWWPADRFKQWGVKLHEPFPDADGDILILGSSEKFHNTMRLPHPTEWTTDLVEQIRKVTGRHIIYRPKPSWANAKAVPNTEFDHGFKTPIERALARSFASVTYGSIACVDSILAGVPCIVLGNAVARPVSFTTVSCLPSPYWPERRMREAWLANLAYSNFAPEEIADGTAWKIIKEQMTYAF